MIINWKRIKDTQDISEEQKWATKNSSPCRRQMWQTWNCQGDL